MFIARIIGSDGKIKILTLRALKQRRCEVAVEWQANVIRHVHSTALLSVVILACPFMKPSTKTFFKVNLS